MQSPSTTWQRRIHIFPSMSSRHVHAESAIWAIMSFAPLDRQFRLEIIQHNPDIFNLLFDCAVLTRPTWHPETQVDSIAWESKAEWKAVCESLKILTARKN